MEISFVIPAYNEEYHIGKCLKSITDEISRLNIAAEVIVVNNASIDKTKEVAESFPGVTVIDEPIKSAVRARNTGFLASRGCLVANVDADSFLTPTWLETALKEFNNNPNLVALSGPYIYYDVSSKFQRGLISIFYFLTYAGYYLNRFILRKSSVLQAGNMVIRRTALEQLGGYNLDFSFYGDDADAARRLHPLGDVAFKPSFKINSSGRRIMTEGIFVMGLRYAINYVWATFLGRPFSKRSIEVRTAETSLAYHPQSRAKEFVIASVVLTVLLGILGTMGFLVAEAAGLNANPKQFAVAIYQKMNDHDYDFSALKNRLQSMKTKLSGSISTSR